MGPAEKILTDRGKTLGIEVVCSKDGTLFDGDLGQFDGFAFYTQGDLCNPKSLDGAPAMTQAGKKKLLDAIAGGKGFIGFHSAMDTFHSSGAKIDPYIAMIGGEFNGHASQQNATMKFVSPKFPGLDGLKDFAFLEEWYTFKNFAKDLHVILVQETAGMKITGADALYNRPPFPSTWARMHEKGRVFATALAHRNDTWEKPETMKVIEAGLHWILKDTDFDPKANIDEVTPKANVLRNPPA